MVIKITTNFEPKMKNQKVVVKKLKSSPEKEKQKNSLIEKRNQPDKTEKLDGEQTSKNRKKS